MNLLLTCSPYISVKHLLTWGIFLSQTWQVGPWSCYNDITHIQNTVFCTSVRSAPNNRLLWHEAELLFSQPRKQPVAMHTLHNTRTWKWHNVYGRCFSFNLHWKNHSRFSSFFHLKPKKWWHVQSKQVLMSTRTTPGKQNGSNGFSQAIASWVPSKTQSSATGFYYKSRQKPQNEEATPELRSTMDPWVL